MNVNDISIPLSRFRREMRKHFTYLEKHPSTVFTVTVNRIPKTKVLSPVYYQQLKDACSTLDIDERRGDSLSANELDEKFDQNKGDIIDELDISTIRKPNHKQERVKDDMQKND